MWSLQRLSLWLKICGELAEAPKASPTSSMKVPEVQHVEKLDLKVPVWLHTLPSFGFPNIKITPFEIVLINLLCTDQPRFWWVAHIELGSQGFKAYTGELSGKVYLQNKRNCEIERLQKRKLTKQLQITLHKPKI